nr:hypothetical protein Iba_scaffold2774CG0010 [Ipomoea batatas]
MAPSLTMYLQLRGTLAHILPGCGKGLTVLGADCTRAEKVAMLPDKEHLLSYRCEVPHTGLVEGLIGFGVCSVVLIWRETQNTSGCENGLLIARIAPISWRGTGRWTIFVTMAEPRDAQF